MAEIKISLASARVNAEMTQAEVAKAMHKSKRTIVSWENGYTDPSIADAQKLCDLYGLPIENINFCAH